MYVYIYIYVERERDVIPAELVQPGAVHGAPRPTSVQPLLQAWEFTKGGRDQRGLGLHLQHTYCSMSCIALRALKRSTSCR